MLPTTTRTPPSVEDYTPLEEFQSQTPESFTGGKPILHFHLTGAKANIPKSQAGSLAIFPSDAASKTPEHANGSTDEIIERDVDVFVNSDNFLIFSKESEAGVSIPYPSISIHAVKALGTEPNPVQAIWMQLEFADGGDNDDDFACVELTIIPPTSATTETPAQKMYTAMAACSDLHPDPNDEDDDDDADNHDRIIFEGSAEHEALEGFSGVMRGQADGSLPPPLPGSGGWITADNVHEYFDEDGNWIGQGAEEQEELGDGAGTRRGRDEDDGEGVNGDGPDDSKRPRVD